MAEPIPFREDYWVYPRLVDLATCVCEELNASGLPQTCFCGVIPGGLAAFDYCTCQGACGQAWTRLVTAYPSVNFPNQSLSATCDQPLAFVIEVGIVRCAPVSNKDGVPPSVSAQLEATRLQMADMAAMVRAIKCCMGHDEDDEDLDYALGVYTPTPPGGGCLGGTWSVTVTQRRRPLGV